MDPEHCWVWLSRIDSLYNDGKTKEEVLHIKRILAPEAKDQRTVQFETTEYGNGVRFCYMPEKDPLGSESFLLLNKIRVNYWENQGLDKENLVYVKSIETYEKNSLRKKINNYLFEPR